MKSLSLEEFLKRQAARLQDVPDDFLEQVGAAQQQIYNRLLQLLSRLERDGDDIAQTPKNQRIADEIREALPGIMDDSKYSSAITAFVKEFDGQKKLFDQMVKTEFGQQVKSKFADMVLEAAKRNAVNVFASQTVTTKFLDGLRSQIDLAVQSGQSFMETVKQLRTYATGGTPDAGANYGGRDKQGGKLLQYSKQIAYDSIAVADRAYTNAAAADLDPEWYLFAGGLMPSSREFCLSRAGKYFHKKEIEGWAKLDWAGKMENTTEANIFIVLGGHNCQHTLIPVTIERVPGEDIERNIANGNFKPNKEEKAAIKEKEKEVVPPPEKEPEKTTLQKPDDKKLSDYYASFDLKKSELNYDEQKFKNIEQVFDHYRSEYKIHSVDDVLSGFASQLEDIQVRGDLAEHFDEAPRATYFKTLHNELKATQEFIDTLPLRMRDEKYFYDIDWKTKVYTPTDKLKFEFQPAPENVGGSVGGFYDKLNNKSGSTNLELNKRFIDTDAPKIDDAYKAGTVFAHEFGHVLDGVLNEDSIGPMTRVDKHSGNVIKVFGRNASESNSPILKRLMDAINDTPEIKKIANELQNAWNDYNRPGDKSFLSYLNSPREKFARAFAQYVAYKTENKNALRILRTDPVDYPDFLKNATQWSDENFKAIADEFDKLFAALL